MNEYWFFSALAQSTAALVGIFSAFIITKMISNQSKFNENLSKIKNFLIHSEYLKHKFKLKNGIIETYSKIISIMILERGTQYDIQENNAQEMAEYYYLIREFPEFIEKDNIIEKINTIINNYKKDKEKYKNNGNKVFTYSSKDINILYAESINKLSNIREEICEIKKNANDMDIFFNYLEIKAESSSIVTIAIIMNLILFFIGFILPLYFLPTIHCWWKIILLPIIAIIYSSFMGKLLYTNIFNLKYNIYDINKLEVHTKLENYSKYLKIAKDVEKFRIDKGKNINIKENKKILDIIKQESRR
jgi:hypothetical protein